MKTMHATLCAAAALALAAAPASAASRSGDAHPFGLGIMLGSPTGLTGKLYLGGKPFALQMGIGAVEDLNNDDFDDDGWQVHVDVVWHPAVLARQPAFTLPFYVGVGGRIAEDDDYYRINGTVYNDEDTFSACVCPSASSWTSTACRSTSSSSWRWWSTSSSSRTASSPTTTIRPTSASTAASACAITSECPISISPRSSPPS
jgi:hypothetical protein